MQRFILLRLGQAILTLLMLSLAVFLSLHLTGDPAIYLLGPDDGLAEYEQMKVNLGLDKPLIVQYGVFLSEISRGDFGKSHTMNRTARELLFGAAPATFQLAFAAFVLTVVVGVPLLIGVCNAGNRL